MNLYASEIDGHGITNEQYLELWQDQFGSIHRKLARCTCINCKKLIKDNDKVDYVACFNGRIVCWHNNCKK